MKSGARVISLTILNTFERTKNLRRQTKHVLDAIIRGLKKVRTTKLFKN